MADGGERSIAGAAQVAVSSPRFTAVSFFAGCGGLDLGFLGGFSYLGRDYGRTAFDVLAAYDSDPQAVETYRTNIGEHIELCDLSAAAMSDMPPADVLLGGFPCQEFSQCGPRGGLNSERGKLYQRMVAYADLHRPRVVVGENVAGLLYRDGGQAVRAIVDDFTALGYRAHVWEMHAHHFGIPQARHRVILAFVRNDLSGRLVQPVPSADLVTAKEALQDLLKPGRSVIPNQSQYFRAARATFGHGQGDERTPANGPAYTVRANSRSRVQFHYSRPRRLTVRECARLQSFPDSFFFPFAATANMRLVGNAVPPVLGHCVAHSVQKFLYSNVVSG